MIIRSKDEPNQGLRIETDRARTSVDAELHEFVQKTVDNARRNHSKLNQKLQEVEHLSNEEMIEINKKLAKLQPTLLCSEKLEHLRKELLGLQDILNDTAEEASIKALADQELHDVKERIQKVEEELLLSIVPEDEVDGKNVILEVRSGTGGEEAGLFALELFQMYQKLAALSNWNFEVIDVVSLERGGCREATASISGPNVYGNIKFEIGVHRVQRVPQTETSGRIHTSAASVAVLPEAEETDIELRPEHLRIDTYRASGAGGQHVNTTDSAIRITHLPTGVIVAIQDERSQHKNKAKALKVLRARLYDIDRQQKAREASSTRMQQIGTGDRSERIRTYNFPQGRITDHRANITVHGIENFMGGDGLSSLLESLAHWKKVQVLQSMLSQ